MNINNIITQGLLLSYLKGEGQYRIFDRDADMPTNTALAIKPIVKAISDNPKIEQIFIDALVQLASDPHYGFLTLYYLYDYFRAAGIQIMQMHSTDFLRMIRGELLKNKSSMFDNFNWMGACAEHGLWSLVIIMSNLIFKEFGIEILPMESSQ